MSPLRKYSTILPVISLRVIEESVCSYWACWLVAMILYQLCGMYQNKYQGKLRENNKHDNKQ